MDFIFDRHILVKMYGKIALRTYKSILQFYNCSTWNNNDETRKQWLDNRKLMEYMCGDNNLYIWFY